MSDVSRLWPGWFYAPGGRSRLCKDAEEKERYCGGPEWGESPALMSQTVEAPAAVGASPTIKKLVDGADTVLKRFYTVPAKTIADQILLLDDLDALREVRDMEDLRPGGPRKGVLQAVLARMENLAAPEPDAPEN